MNQEGFKLVEKAVVVDKPLLSNNEEMHSREPDEDEALAFVDISTHSPAKVLNRLEQADLLSTPQRKEEELRQTQAEAEERPRLALVNIAYQPNVSRFLMTFVDTQVIDFSS